MLYYFRFINPNTISQTHEYALMKIIFNYDEKIRNFYYVGILIKDILPHWVNDLLRVDGGKIGDLVVWDGIGRYWRIL